ncbi:MAG: copper amine oxidase N-terminal domain-containing protein [Ruminococcaceae bacterium]|nr:copper amine oxidase N-terminal domain-containing protein [Oscillospiraceae bacterium]
MKKRVVSMMLIVSMILSLFTAVAFANDSTVSTQDNEISICINGMYVTFDQMPFNKDGRVLVPLRGIFEVLGASVEYDGETRKITAKNLVVFVPLPSS